MIDESKSVIHPWVFDIPLLSQSALLSCIRGCDGVPNDDLSKEMTRAIRCLICRKDLTKYGWADNPNAVPVIDTAKAFYKRSGTYPSHFVEHINKAVRAIAYSHPDEEVSALWLEVYKIGARKMGCAIETKEVFLARLESELL